MKKTKTLLQLLPSIALLLAVVLAAGSSGCSLLGGDNSSSDSQTSSSSSQSESDGYPVTVAEVIVPEQPEKVLSLSPSLTEILCDLGYASRLAGVSDYCDYPQAVASKPKLGTVQLPDLEAIRETGAKYLFTETAFAEQDLIALQQAQIEVICLTPAKTLEELKKLYTSLCTVMDGETEGKAAAQKAMDGYQAQLDSAAAAVKALADARGEAVKVAYLRVMPFTVAGGDTLEGRLLEAIGFENVAGDYSQWSYPESKLSEYKPDFFFLDSSITIKMLEQHASYKNLNATIKDRYYNLDMLVFERQGARMFDALEEMAKAAAEKLG